MNVVLIGSAGSGKTSIVAEFEKCFISPISTSGMLREYAATKKSGSEIITECMRRGIDIPRYLFEKALKYKIASIDKNSFIMDGIYGVEQLHTVLRHLKVDKYIYLEVSKKVAEDRVRKRAREDYNEEFLTNRMESFYYEIEDIKNRIGDSLHIIDASLPKETVMAKVYDILNSDQEGFTILENGLTERNKAYIVT